MKNKLVKNTFSYCWTCQIWHYRWRFKSQCDLCMCNLVFHEIGTLFYVLHVTCVVNWLASNTNFSSLLLLLSLFGLFIALKTKCKRLIFRFFFILCASLQQQFLIYFSVFHLMKWVCVMCFFFCDTETNNIIMLFAKNLTVSV